MSNKKIDKILESKNLYEYLIVPMVHNKPDNVSMKDWLDYLFCVSTRFIDRFVVNTDFKMPGAYYAAANVPIPGMGFTKVKKGDILWIRYDTTVPDRFDIELIGTKGRWQLKDQVFRLTDLDWIKIKQFIEPYEYISRT